MAQKARWQTRARHSASTGMKRRAFIKATACVACIPGLVFSARAVPRVGWADLRDKRGRVLSSVEGCSLKSPLTDKAAAMVIRQLPLRLRRELHWHMDRQAFLSLYYYRTGCNARHIEMSRYCCVYSPPPNYIEGFPIEHVYDNNA